MLDHDKHQDSESTLSRSDSCTSMVHKLPKRVKGGCTTMKPIKLVTNQYKVNLGADLDIGVYSIKFTPRFSEDNRELRLKMLAEVRKDIQLNFKQPVVFSGFTMYSCTNGKDVLPQLTTIPITYNGTDYVVALKLVRNIKMTDLGSEDDTKSKIPLNFLNTLLKNQLRLLGYGEIGKSRKFFDMSNQVEIANTGLFLCKGYCTSFNMLESGLYLKVEPANKIVRRDSVLLVVNNIYKKYNDKSKDQKRNLLKEELIGQCVMTNYGTNKCWRIEDVAFDIDPDKLIIDKHTNTSLTEYYKTKYGLTMTNKKQPLLVTKDRDRIRKKKEGEDERVLLVPEFLRMTGIPDDFDERRRRDISEFTIRPAQEKLEKVRDFMDIMTKELKELKIQDMRKQLQIDISPKPSVIEGYQMKEPRLKLGKNCEVDSGKAANFQLFNKPLFQTKEKLRLYIIHFSSYDTRSLINLFDSTSRNLNLAFEPKTKDLGQFTNRNGLDQVLDILADQNSYIKDNFNCVMTILPGNMKSQYSKVKKAALTNHSSIVTQVALETTLAKKGFNSIATKILLQIASKTGNVPWLPQKPSTLGQNVMMIGIDSTPSKSEKSESVVGFCATIDGNMSKFFSKVVYQPKKDIRITKMRELIAKSLEAYEARNKRFPSDIIVIRDGCAQGQMMMLKNTEVEEALHGINAMCGASKIGLLYLSVDRKVSQKFFVETNGKVFNPQYGTLINSTVVSSNYDFYMVAQNCNKGAATPTYYKVIHDSSSLNEGQLEELIYSQCFNYMNWSGSVRVPGVCQYARKLATFVGQNLPRFDQMDEAVSQRLYFI